MLTIEKLKKYGANVEEGVLRCAKNEALYIRLVGMIPNNPGFNKLYEAIKLIKNVTGTATCGILASIIMSAKYTNKTPKIPP